MKNNLLKLHSGYRRLIAGRTPKFKDLIIPIAASSKTMLDKILGVGHYSCAIPIITVDKKNSSPPAGKKKEKKK